MKDLVVNGKVYPMWQQFVQRQDEWIGGVLEDISLMRFLTTEITGIILRPNGDDSAWFEITGKDFSCGSDVQHLGVTAGEKGWITLSGYMHTFRFKQP